ncbi:MAG: hypothetical protein IJL85_02945 [Erysipelotrichaceae bacterium]|nr:hypothetical protein [Erysipelotrichaceae bacterium]
MIKNKDLDSFEHDDWLKKERARESRISAWDFDDARKLRQEHEDDCDAKDVAQTHRVRHARSNMMNDHTLSRINGSSTTANDIVWFIIDFIALFILIFLNTMMFRHWQFYWPIIILFLGINPGIFVWLGLFKRFPPAKYSKCLLFTAILIEAVGFLYYFVYYHGYYYFF